MGLEAGDIVLGYDGIPWKKLYHELLAAELPVTTFTEPFSGVGLGSSEKSVAHIWLMSAGLNWHLFDTIYIIKYGSIDTLHLPTSALNGLNKQLICTEQMPIPGVPMPDISTTDAGWISWGIVEGTQIGYIYVTAWVREYGAGAAFTNAVNTLLDDYQTTGLIIDCRTNRGGQMDEANVGLSRLFNFDLNALEIAERSDPDDHFAMRSLPSGYCSGQNFRFHADPYLYDKPIAVLTGPIAVSAGDYNAMRLKYHPMASIFGKPTNTAFTCYSGDYLHVLNIPFQGWLAECAPRNIYLSDDPDNYLMHVGFEVDEEIWLTQEDVAKGEDTVVKRAIEWINNLTHAHDVTVDKTYAKPGIDTAIVTAQVENPNQHQLLITADLHNRDGVLIDSLSLFDDGMHEDGIAGDSLWGNFYTPSEEHTFAISLKTEDVTANTSRTLPKVTWFTTKGPVTVDHVEFAPSDTIPNPGDQMQFRLHMKNNGSVASVKNLKIGLTQIDTCALTYSSKFFIDSLKAGEIKEHSGGFSIKISDGCIAPLSIPIQVDIYEGNYLFWVDTLYIDVVTGIADFKPNTPNKFALHQNYPNPFNPVTTINYQLPQTSEVDLSIYNILGQKVSTLVAEKQPAGKYKIEWDANDFASGVYLYRLETDKEFVQTKKLILLK